MHISLQGIIMLTFTVQGLVVQGLTVQGLIVQGITVLGITVKGITCRALLAWHYCWALLCRVPSVQCNHLLMVWSQDSS